MNNRFGFNIDVVGTCNLKCPSCPVGNSQDISNPSGIMPPKLLRKILEKAAHECEITFVGLFNWTEPLIHPQLPELIEIVESYAPCHLSSNLNLMKVDFEKILIKNPSYFRISVSGFNQIIYGSTHKNGDIERVKHNMALLANAKKTVNSNTKIEVLYHRYLGNLDDEVLMKDFSENLGFSFLPVWAYMMPLEKIFDCIDNPAVLSDQDKDILAKLALPPSKKVIQTAKKYKKLPCVLREEQITLNYKGDVQLCCGVFNQEKYTLANYLSKPLTEIQAIKHTYPICVDCMDKGLHVLAIYGAPEFNKIAINNIAQHYNENLNLSFKCKIMDIINITKKKLLRS